MKTTKSLNKINNKVKGIKVFNIVQFTAALQIYDLTLTKQSLYANIERR